MQTLASIRALVQECKFNDWTFRVDEYADGTPYVQVLFMDKDRISGKEELQRCRKWVLSLHSTNSEIIRAVFKAVEGAMIHEVQEAFKFRGARIYNPHLDLEELADAINAKAVGVSLRDESAYVPTVPST
jgi:hypothetical protein